VAAPAAPPPGRRRYHRDDRRATPEEMAAMRAEYLEAKAKREGRPTHYACPCAVHQPVKVGCVHGVA
jgi:hypothetical protein